MEDRSQSFGAKEAAVENWEAALAELDGDTEDEQFLCEADIHDRQDRREIEEILDHGDISNGVGLADAFDELRTHFEDVW